MRDISRSEKFKNNRDNFAQTKRDFEQIKVFNKYGNVDQAFGRISPERKSPSPKRAAGHGAYTQYV